MASSNPSQVDYWYDLLPVNRWILNAKHSRAEYFDRLGLWPEGEVWVYNRRYTFDSPQLLSVQMQQFGATGYLHWYIDWYLLPLVDITGATTYDLLPDMTRLLEELAIVREAQTDRIWDGLGEAQNEAPYLRFDVVFPASGIYYLHARTIGAASNEDTIHFGLDGEIPTTAANIGCASLAWRVAPTAA